ncbi:MAG: DUF4271 domain-containing protein [Bacteroidales bacterium]|nr:DUF4271 domain-containing protein [Bacteroidales bacterium]
MSDTTQVTFPAPFYLADTTAIDTTTPYYEQIKDSIYLNFAPHQPAVQRESLFRNHSLQPTHTALVPRADSAPSPWFFGMLIFATMAVVYYLRTYRIRYSDLLHACVDRPALERLLRDSNLTRHRSLSIIIVMLGAVLALGLALAAGYSSGLDGLLVFLVAWAGSVALMFLRNGFARLMGNIFEDKEAVAAYISSNYMYYLVETSAAPLLLFAAAYSPGANDLFLIAAGILIAIFFGMRLFRGMRTILTFSKYAKFYLFYYLCIFEIVPLIVLIKTFITL